MAGGNEKAFEQLVKKYQHAAFNTIYRYIGNYDDVEDIAQEVFIKIWRHAGSFKGKSKFSTWFYRIIVNQCLNYRKKYKQKLESKSQGIRKNLFGWSFLTKK